MQPLNDVMVKDIGNFLFSVDLEGLTSDDGPENKFMSYKSKMENHSSNKPFINFINNRHTT